MQKIRSFFAVELNEEIRSKIIEEQELLKASGADVKWVERQNIHLTLKFLGEVLEPDIIKLRALTAEKIKLHKPCDISFNEIGYFGERGRINVIWVGCEGDIKALELVFNAIEDAAKEIGVPKEKRRFSPHVTIGRVRTGCNIDKLKSALDRVRGSERLWRHDAEHHLFGTQKVLEITLFQSKLSPEGPTYIALDRFKLT